MVVASIVRLIFLVAFYFKHSADLTFNLLLPWFVTLAEIGVGIVGACLPCLMVSALSTVQLPLENTSQQVREP